MFRYITRCFSIAIILTLLVVFLNVLSQRELIYSVSTIVIITMFRLLPKKRRIMDLFYPKYILLILFFLYSLAGISAIEVIGRDSQGTVIPEYIIDSYIISCLIGLLGLCTGFYFYEAKGYSTLKKVAFNDSKALKILLAYSLIAVVINLGDILAKYNFISVQSYAETALTYRLNFQESRSSGLKQVFLTDSPVMIFNFYFITRFFNARNKLISWLWLVPYTACILTALLSGFRGHLVILLLPLIFIYHYRVRKFELNPPKVLLMVFTGIIGYTTINLLALLRSTSNVKEMLAIINKLIVNKSLAFNSLAYSGELTTSLNMMRLMLGFDKGEVGFTYGMSIINEFLVFIPLAIFPNRPNTISERFVLTFHPEIYKIGGGMGQFCLLEGYWAFGNIGVFLTSITFAYLSAKLYGSIAPYFASSSIYVLFYALSFNSIVVSVVRGGYIGAIKGVIINGIVIILAIVISKKIKL